MLHAKRMTARPQGDFALFLIGMRINKPLSLHKWVPIAAAMPRMLRELYSRPELGFLSHEMWFSRTIILIQYWRSVEYLIDYAQAKNANHLPAWQRFNKSVGTDGSVGIWHETYKIQSGGHENVYVNMPVFGLGKVGPLVEARSALQSATGRFRADA